MQHFLYSLLTNDSHSKAAGIFGALVSFIAPYQNDLVRSLFSIGTGLTLYLLTKLLERTVFKKKKGDE